MTSSSPAALFDSLHELLHLFRTRVRHRIEALHPDLTLNEMRVLMHTGRHAGLTQKDLIERSHTDKAQMARILAGLEVRGLLERTPSEHDRRVRCLRLSAQGEKLFGDLRDVQHEVASELLKNMPAKARDDMLKSLRQASDTAG